MKRYVFSFLFSFVPMLLFSQGQSIPRSFVNTTGKVVGVYDIRYYPDSTAVCGYILLPTSGSWGSTNIYNRCIRLDLIAIDNSTKDTVFVKSYTRAEIEMGVFVIESGVIQKLAPLEPTSRLILKATKFSIMYRLGDTLNFKLVTKEKIVGRLIAFNNEYVTLVLGDNTNRKIYSKDVLAVKSYSDGLTQEKYFKTPKIKYIEVVQRFNKKESEFQWVELKGIKLKEKK